MSTVRTAVGFDTHCNTEHQLETLLVKLERDLQGGEFLYYKMISDCFRIGLACRNLTVVQLGNLVYVHMKPHRCETDRDGKFSKFLFTNGNSLSDPIPRYTTDNYFGRDREQRFLPLSELIWILGFRRKLPALLAFVSCEKPGPVSRFNRRDGDHAVFFRVIGFM